MTELRLSFAGDLFLSGSYAATPEDRCAGLLDGVSDVLRSSALAFANLEGAVSDGFHDATGAAAKILMPIRPRYIDALREGGLDVVSLSNNHVCDFGAEGLARTTAALDRAGLRWFGAGGDADSAARPELMMVEGVRIGFIGFTSDATHPGEGAGVASLERCGAAARVAQAKAACDVLVVSLHWGDEHVSWPSPEQVCLARSLVDAGADVIAGHHAHVLQGWERWGTGVIFYGLGGLTVAELQQRVVWQGEEQAYRFVPTSRHRRSAIAGVTLRDGRVAEVLWHPVQIGPDGRPRLQPGAFALRWSLVRLLVRTPGYGLVYRSILGWQFGLQPRLKAALSPAHWRRWLGRRFKAAVPRA